MALKRSNDTFLLTLVDFLIQVLFFSLFVFVAYQASKHDREKEIDPAKVAKAIKVAGVSNLTELNDELSKLAPVGLKGVNARLNKDGNATDINRVLAKLDQGTDKPPCLFSVVNGKKQAKSLGLMIGSDRQLWFSNKTPELDALLGKIGLRYEAVQAISLNEFSRKFQPILKIDPACRYVVDFQERTKMVDARDAVQKIFYTRIKR